MSSPESSGVSGPHQFPPHHQISTADGFDIANLVQQRTEPALEVAGPTVRDEKSGLAAYAIWGDLPVPPKLYVSNLYASASQPLDLRLRASQLPFRAASLGIVAASKLWDFEMHGSDTVYGLHERFIVEAKRCLVPDGLLVMTGLRPGTVWLASQQLGFTILRASQPSHDQLLQQAIFLNRPPQPSQTYTTLAIPA